MDISIEGELMRDEEGCFLKRVMKKKSIVLNKKVKNIDIIYI